MVQGTMIGQGLPRFCMHQFRSLCVGGPHCAVVLGWCKAEPVLLAAGLRLPTGSFRRQGTVVLVDEGTNVSAPLHFATPADAVVTASGRSTPSRTAPWFAGTSNSFQQTDPPLKSRTYTLPKEYSELLHQEFEDQADGSSAGGKEHRRTEEESIAATAVEDRGWRRKFWRSVRHTARKRLAASSGPDTLEWQRRIALLHESMWVEELGVTLELSSMRTTVDVLDSVGEGQFTIDVMHICDRLGIPLQENNILRGLRLFIRCQAGDEYRTTVQPLGGAGKLLLSAPAQLAGAEGPFTLEFHPHRFQQIAMHRALDSPRVESIIRATLPEEDVVIQAAEETGDKVGDGEREAKFQALPASLNDAQRRAVVAAISHGVDTPLVVWGPPGTGKSTLAAFIVWHLLKQRPTDAHVLVAAPSNTAADVLCTKLAKLGLDKDQMLRLNAVGRSFASVPEIIKDFSIYAHGEDGRVTFTIPPVKELRRFKVVVSTCICAAHISNALRATGVHSGWFSHVVVDEAGEATEPETLVCLALLRAVAGRAVLLGDHFQLGPLVISPFAAELASLDSSMIERLANERFEAARLGEAKANWSRDTLLECEHRGLFFLTESFRSHQAIMDLYSQIFYSGQLDHRPRQQQLTVLGFFEAYGLGETPFIMHNMVGTELQDADSPSLYNLAEIRVVLKYVVDLLQDASLGLEAKDIGIITPYTKQVRTMERELESMGQAFTGVEVGTVEHFQGQERRVVLLSTVRTSSMDHHQNRGSSGTERRPIGFVADPKRLNVAISRAVAGLIIVGDLAMLSKHSPHWRRLVQMGMESGAVRGAPLSLDSHSSRANTNTTLADAPTPPRPITTADASTAWNVLTDN